MMIDSSLHVNSLKHLAFIEMGQSPSSKSYIYEAEAGIPFLQGTADFGAIHPTPRVYSNEANKFADKDDILVSVRAPVGTLNIADQVYGIGRGLCAVRCRKGLHKRFAWWALHWATAQLALEATGSTYDAVAAEDVANLLLPAYPFNTQKAIADYLDRETAVIDALVAAMEKLLTLLAEKRQATITQAVTRGLDLTTPTRHTGIPWLPQIPAHWKVANLKRLAEVRTGVAIGRNLGIKSTVKVPYLRVANVQDGYLDLSDVSMIEVLPKEVASFNLQKGDVLMNKGGDIDKLGRGAVWDGSIEPCLHQNHVFAVRCVSIDPDWLSLVTSSTLAKSYFESRAKRTTNLASISATNLKELPVPVPPNKEQKAILNAVAGSLNKLDRLSTAIIDAVNLLNERRVSLISAAVTGQI